MAVRTTTLTPAVEELAVLDTDTEVLDIQWEVTLEDMAVDTIPDMAVDTEDMVADLAEDTAVDMVLLEALEDMLDMVDTDLLMDIPDLEEEPWDHVVVLSMLAVSEGESVVIPVTGQATKVLNVTSLL